MDQWQGFFAAQLGAAATLGGLILVGVSINLSKILSNSRLPSRAVEALVLLISVLVVFSLLLVPAQPERLIGVEVLIVGLLAWMIVTAITLRTWRTGEDQSVRLALLRLALNQLSLLPYMIAGIKILL